MGTLIPYEVFRAKQREKKYGKPVPMAAYGYPDDFNPFARERDNDFEDMGEEEWTNFTT